MYVPNVGWKTSSLVLGGRTGCIGQIGVVILRWEGIFTVHFVGVKTRTEISELLWDERGGP
jgi:hypothetical protein